MQSGKAIVRPFRSHTQALDAGAALCLRAEGGADSAVAGDRRCARGLAMPPAKGRAHYSLPYLRRSCAPAYDRCKLLNQARAAVSRARHSLCSSSAVACMAPGLRCAPSKRASALR